MFPEIGLDACAEGGAGGSDSVQAFGVEVVVDAVEDVGEVLPIEHAGGRPHWDDVDDVALLMLVLMLMSMDIQQEEVEREA